ncbi:protein of unknown function DUF1830 [Stanieria cyanosphaera PCC 7437]|uniref:DUF1830 domain-containing protein n=1 Tax=Stanieria cyanosphaera (strain ATCC 29371 / PCC 7437) TaxID=111780 RepID=K9XWK2_STAC7|nr:DUF1830 domain-containing protein [Stanieria cyanosphaera]AFZ36461.1 protein of unknown function DUF1830 [Stanieria cyanosphaera PCC 7437]
MTQIFFPQDLELKNKHLCCYINRTNKIVIVRLHGIPKRDCERVIFPQERFLFEAPIVSELEVVQAYSTNIFKDMIPCSELIVKENNLTNVV